MPVGTVKSWNDDGWGVLVSEEIDGEIFAHFSAIQATGYRSLTPGESVTFDGEPFPSGQDGYRYRARRIIRGEA